MGNQTSSYPKPVKTPLPPMSAIINFLNIDDLRNVRLTSRETNVAATGVLKLKHMKCETMVLGGSWRYNTTRMNNRLKFLVNSGILKSQKKLVIGTNRINNNDLTADGFAYLTGLDIEAIVLRNMIIPNNCLDCLAQMKSLQSFSISRTEISIAYATQVLSHLEELSLDCRPLEIGDFVHLGGMHALKSLTLWKCAPGRCLEHIASCLGERLESLDIHFSSGFSIDDVRTIAGMRSLRSLKLRNQRSVNLSPLTGLENLDILHIYFPITEQSLIDVGRSMHSLRHLGLGDCEEIKDEDLWHLGSLQALEVLKICWSYRLTGTGLTHLHQLTSLKTLSLVHCTELVDENIREIVRNVPSLRCVYISDCKNISSTVRDGLICPGVIIKVDDELSEEERGKWGYSKWYW